MVLAAVHDVDEPVPDHESVVAALAGAHGGVDVLAAVVDEGYGADEELGAVCQFRHGKGGLNGVLKGERGGGGGVETYGSAGGEALDDPPLIVGVSQLLDGILPLDDLELGTPLLHELDDAPPGHAVEDDLVVQRGGDELGLAGVLRLPHDEEVARAGLGAQLVLAVQPQDLVEAVVTGAGGLLERRAVVGADLGEAEPAGPGAHEVVG